VFVSLKTTYLRTLAMHFLKKQCKEVPTFHHVQRHGGERWKCGD